MATPEPTRADDEDLLNWLVLRDAGWPLSLIAAIWRVPKGRVAMAIDLVRAADAFAHRPQPVAVRA